MNTIDINSLIGLGAVPVIAALVQVVKPFIKDGRWYPPISIVIGIGINLFGAKYLNSIDIFTATLTGAIAGLAASGLYSLTQVGKVDEPTDPAVKKIIETINKVSEEKKP